MTNSFLQEHQQINTNTWQLVEWHPGNLFLGHAEVNMAIQNRFDAADQAFNRHGETHIGNLFNLWHSANSLCGLSPTGILTVSIYSTHLSDSINVIAAQHNNSRPLQAAIGWIGTSDYP